MSIVLSSSSDSVDKAIDEYSDRSSFSGSSDSDSSCGSSSGGNTTDEYRVVIFLVSSVAPLSMGRQEIFDFWVLCQRIGDTCHNLIRRKSRRFA